LVKPARTDPAGLTGPTRKEARGRAWRRTSQGFYLPAEVDSSVPEQRAVEAAVVLPDGCAVTGWAALRWLGDPWSGGLERDGVGLRPVTLVIASQDIRPQPGMALSAERLGPDELLRVDGLVLTNAIRSVCFEVRYADGLHEAVTWLDMAAYSDLVSAPELEVFAKSLNGWTGVPLLRKALPLMKENSWSPQETRVRLVWTLVAELPTPLCNRPIFDRAGHHLGTPDLLDPVAGLVGEYDGALHLQGTQRRRDRERDETYRRHGLEVVTILRGDLAERDRLASRLLEAYARCRPQPRAQRLWTTDLPAWWTPTDTVERRRALTDAQRERLLRYRLRVA